MEIHLQNGSVVKDVKCEDPLVGGDNVFGSFYVDENLFFDIDEMMDFIEEELSSKGITVTKELIQEIFRAEEKYLKLKGFLLADEICCKEDIHGNVPP